MTFGHPDRSYPAANELLLPDAIALSDLAASDACEGGSPATTRLLAGDPGVANATGHPTQPENAHRQDPSAPCPRSPTTNLLASCMFWDSFRGGSRAVCVRDRCGGSYLSRRSGYLETSRDPNRAGLDLRGLSALVALRSHLRSGNLSDSNGSGWQAVPGHPPSTGSRLDIRR